MKFIRFWPVLFLLMDGCIDPLPVETNTTTHNLVVDGAITNEPGPYQVRLSYSGDLDKSLKKTDPVTNASIQIINDLNETETLTEVQSGLYETAQNGMQGEIGRSYHIKILTSTGREYTSTPQKLVHAGTIENIYAEFQKNALNGDEPSRPQDALNVFIDGHSAEGESHFLRWRWTGVYHGITYPQFKTKGLPGGGSVPIPPSCSGYITDGVIIMKVGECTCCSCWPYEYSTNAVVSDLHFMTLNSFRKVQVAKIPTTPMRLHDKYFFEVEQISLSKDVYNFWKLVQAQQESAVSLFQPGAVKVTGNIQAVNSKDAAFGVFEVSAVVKKRFFLTQDMLPGALPPISQIAEDCRLVYTNGSNEKPIFW